MPYYEKQEIVVRLTARVKQQFEAYKRKYHSVAEAARASERFNEQQLYRYLTENKKNGVPVDHYLVVCQAEDRGERLAGIKAVISNIAAVDIGKLVEDYARYYGCYGRRRRSGEQGVLTYRLAESLAKPLGRTYQTLGLILDKKQKNIPFEMILCMAKGLRRKGVGEYCDLFMFNEQEVSCKAILKHLGLALDFDKIAEPVPTPRGDEEDLENWNRGIGSSDSSERVSRQRGFKTLPDDELHEGGHLPYAGRKPNWEGVDELEKSRKDEP